MEPTNPVPDVDVTQLGTMAARFHIEGTIGRGAMGVVYRAWDRALDRRVALKTMTVPPEATPELAEELHHRFVREGRAGSRLSHPNIVSILACGGDYIAMELVEGETLAAVMARGRLRPFTALGILQQIAAALDHAHAAGVVHRDVKPANILMDARGRVKVADFGIAKVAGGTTGLTRDILGTPLYMAPEQVLGRRATAASDNFALAVVAYELLTGRQPFAGDTLPSIMNRVLRDDPPPPSRVDPSLPPEVDDVLRKGLVKDPRRRPATASLFVASLRTALVSGMTFERPLGQIPERRAGRSWMALAPVAAGVSVLCLLLALPGRRDPAPARTEPALQRKPSPSATTPMTPAAAPDDPPPAAPARVTVAATPDAPPAWIEASPSPAPGREAHGLDVFDGAAPLTGGAVVRRVIPGSSAEAAGLQPKDIIVAWDGVPVAGSGDVPATAATTVPIDILRDIDAKLVPLRLTLVAAPPETTAPRGAEGEQRHEVDTSQGSLGTGGVADPDGADAAPVDQPADGPDADGDPGGGLGDPPDPGPLTPP